MYRKTNTITTAILEQQEKNQAPFYKQWRFFRKIDSHLYILVRTRKSQIDYAPLYMFQIPLVNFGKRTEAQKFLQNYPDPTKLTCTADKLRWYRYQNSLLQREVAEYAGITRKTYIYYECGEHEYYAPDKLERIAELFGVDITALLDEYNLFLYQGQGKQIREFRKNLGLTQAQYGKRYGISASTVKRWENDRVMILKSTWEKLVSDTERP